MDFEALRDLFRDGVMPDGGAEWCQVFQMQAAQAAARAQSCTSLGDVGYRSVFKAHEANQGMGFAVSEVGHGLRHAGIRDERVQ